jgi:bifunctional non-homologous end joining protein LigD
MDDVAVQALQSRGAVCHLRLGGQSQLLYVDHIEKRGCEFFPRICDLDLEGIVAKRASSKYRVTEQPSRDWIKIKEPEFLERITRGYTTTEIFPLLLTAPRPESWRLWRSGFLRHALNRSS